MTAPVCSTDPRPLHLAAAGARMAGDLAAAEDFWRRAIAADPDCAEACAGLGALLHEQGHSVEAEALYRRALAIRPGQIETQANLCVLLHRAKRWPEAEAAYRQALAIDPGHAASHNHLAVLLHDLQRWPEAEASFRQAIELAPENADAHYNFGILLEDRRRGDAAENEYRRALAIDSEHASARFNLACLLLSQGRYGEAWPLHEARYDPRRGGDVVPPPALPCPQWRGEDLTGRSLLVWPEQGFGDQIQFARFLPALKAAGASRITLVCAAPLHALLATASGVDRVIDEDAARAGEAKSHDCWTYALSIPLHLGTTLESIPRALPFLAADPQRIAAWSGLLPAAGFRVGLVWQGSSGHRQDRHRSLPDLAPLKPLWAVPGVVWCSLQIGGRGSPCAGMPLIDLGSHIRDFADSAAIIAQLDLLICVDTAIAHLAGSLGKPCWVLLSAIGTDWRWLDARSDSPWYPGVMRLFRQIVADDWSAPVAAMAMALRGLALPFPAAGVPVPAQRPAEPGDPLAAAIALYARGEIAAATERVRSLLAIHPDHAAALNLAAACARAAGQAASAEAHWLRAIELRPDYADAHNNLGALLCDLDRVGEAEAAYRRALAIRPDYAEARYNLGNLLQRLERADEAEAAYLAALAIRPEYPDALNNLGNLLRTQQRWPEAEAAYRRALAVSPDFVQAQSNLGVVLKDQRRWPEAEAAVARALALCPEFAEAHNGHGVLCKEMKRWPEAEMAYRRALAIRPDYVEAWFNLGNLLTACNRWAEAEAAYRRALTLRPGNADAHAGLGHLFAMTGDAADAEAEFRRALALRPDADTRFNLACLLLGLGRYEEAWPLYEARHEPGRKTDPFPSLALPWPQWQGEDLAGKSLLILPEQGYGDQIQFARYVPLLKQAGAARITIVAAPPLQALFRTLPGADAIVDGSALAASGAHDFWTYPISIARHRRTTPATIPAQIPYLAADPERRAAWRSRLPAGGRRVGLVWRGSPTHRNDANRSLPDLLPLAPLWSIPGIAWCSLQIDGEEAESALPGQPLHSFGRELHDFAETAAIIAELDLLICVDTAVAHLAGSLGKPCWILLPRVGTDWRWLHARADSPWYPGGTSLFRQQAAGDWSAPIAEMAAALRAGGIDRRPDLAGSFG